MIVSPWDGGTTLYEQALNVRGAIQEVIAANVANEETPGYRALRLPFKEALDVAMTGLGPLMARQTHERHLGGADLDHPHFLQAATTMMGSGIDGNTVNLEKEMALMAGNSLLYMATAQFIAGRFTGWRNAISEGR